MSLAPSAAGWLARLGHLAEIGAAWVLHALVRPVPLDTRIRLSGRIGRLVLARLPLARRRIDRGLDLALPGLGAEARARLRAEVGDHFGRMTAEFDSLPALLAGPARTSLSGPGLAPLRAAQAAGRGALLVSAHFGNWEMIRIALAAEGIPCAMLYRRYNNPWFDSIVRGRMEAVSPGVYAKGREGLRGFLTHVAKGGVALILVDQKETGAPLLPFLGHPAETVLMAAELASRRGVPLIPAFATRDQDGLRFRVDIEEPVPEGSAADRMTAVNDRISARILATPGQWFWLHNRWRSRAGPPG